MWPLNSSHFPRRKHLDAAPIPLAAPLSRLKLFLALSRTPHGLLDLATPALAALLWLGGLPSLRVAVLGLVTAFAGYTAVYALNDLVDYRADQEKIRGGGLQEDGGYLDGALVRHPLAHGLLGLKDGLFWAGGWALVALAGAYLLNPACAGIFLAGCLLETVYCLLLSVSHLRTLVSGVVKTLGAMAAVYAVDPSPSPFLLLLMFLWLFLWEIGGQNIPADWHDLQEDRLFQARTLPVRYGLRGAGSIGLGCLGLSVALSPLVLGLSPARLSLPLLAAGLGCGIYLLLLPAWRLYRGQARGQASTLFNQASYYPLALLLVILAGFMS
jgi:4-hydroxybenzoate polyprenyltransferase